MATAVATTSADRASASEIRPSGKVYNARSRDLEHCFRYCIDRTEFLREAKQPYKAHE